MIVYCDHYDTQPDVIQYRGQENTMYFYWGYKIELGHVIVPQYPPKPLHVQLGTRLYLKDQLTDK